MAKKRYTPEQIVAKIREAEVELSKGQSTPQVCKKLAADQAIDISILKEVSSGKY